MLISRKSMLWAIVQYMAKSPNRMVPMGELMAHFHVNSHNIKGRFRLLAKEGLVKPSKYNTKESRKAGTDRYYLTPLGIQQAAVAAPRLGDLTKPKLFKPVQKSVLPPLYPYRRKDERSPSPRLPDIAPVEKKPDSPLYLL